MPGPTTAEQLVCFFLDGEELGVPIAEVKETITVRPLARVFHVPDFIAGLINLRGEVVAVIDLGRLLGYPPRPPRPEARIVILRGRSAGRPVSAGLLVDRLSDVRDYFPEALRPPPATVAPEAAILFRGILRQGDRPLAVLDLSRLFESERLQQYRRRA